MSKARDLIDKLCGRGCLSKEELGYILSGRTGAADEALLFQRADAVRAACTGSGIIVRAIVEFSNLCRNRCAYCGLNAGNVRLRRYCMTEKEILGCARAVHKAGIGSIVLQSGESLSVKADWLAEVLKRIKSLYPMAVTLSAGERSRADYALWRKAGADRYLLKIETTSSVLYRRLHPGMELESRLRCLRILKELGYQTGSGSITGLPGQTAETIARDLLFFRRSGMGMIGIGPFIPHPQTPLASRAAGDPALTLRALALARLLNPYSHIPATTALQCASAGNYCRGLECGANVVMINFTPAACRTLYSLYPGRQGHIAGAGRAIEALRSAAGGSGRELDFSRGDVLEPGAVRFKYIKYPRQKTL